MTWALGQYQVKALLLTFMVCFIIADSKTTFFLASEQEDSP